ncbi:MAG: hypothetical protein IPL84_03550, partial [Chitinophagaceae bacterium]|nr:hypothetical protein [Chitinophagaceae bacterium]
KVKRIQVLGRQPFSNAIGIKNTALGYHALTSNLAGYWVAPLPPAAILLLADSAANATYGNDNVATGNHALSKTAAEVIT